MTDEPPPAGRGSSQGQPPGGPPGQPTGSNTRGPKPFWRRTPFLMAAPPLILVMIITIVAACGGSSPATSGSPAGSPSVAAGSPSAAAGSPSAAPSPLPSSEAASICANVGAEVIAYGSASAQAEESLYKITYAQVQQAVQDQCPKLSQDLTP
jgi:hypothetical protein